jgi:hypothetical protein
MKGGMTQVALLTLVIDLRQLYDSNTTMQHVRPL